MSAAQNPLFTVNPPASPEAEMAYLGSILINPAALSDTMHIIAPEDFYLLRHQHIYAAMCRLQDRQVPVDPELLADDLEAMRQLEAVGGRAYMFALANSTPTSVHAEYYAQIIQRAATRRQLLRVADEMKALAVDESLDLEAVKSDIEQRITTALEHGARDVRSVPLADALEMQWAEIDAVVDGGVVPARIPSRHPEGHKIVRGYLNKAVYTIAARPGVGKSSWLHSESVHIARYFRDSGTLQRVVIYSLEMPERQVTNAIAAIEAGIPYTSLDDRTLSPAEITALSRASNELRTLPIDIVDSISTYEDIEADIRRRWRRNELGVAMIDQLSLLATRRAFKGESAERQTINYIMPAYKRLAMAVDAPLFMLHQVNREGDGEPRLKHLKDSGRVEEQSDAVFFLHRDMEEAETLEPDELQDTTFIVAKNRHGRVGRFTIAFRGAYKSFVSKATARQTDAALTSGKGAHNAYRD